MDKFISLFKATFIDNFNLNKWLGKGNNGSTSVLKRIGFIALYFLLVLYLAGVAVLYTSVGIDYFAKYNLQYLVISLFIFVSVISVFTMSVLKSKSTIFSRKDTDMLFSMPIKPSVVLANKMVNFLLNNYLLVLVIMLPATITYGVILKMSALYYIYSIIAILFLPIIPTVLASIIGYIVAKLSSRSKKKSLVEIVFTFIFILLIFALSMFGQVLMQKLVTSVDTINNILKTAFYPIYLMQEAMIKLDLLSLLLFVAISLVLFVVFVVVLNRSYVKISLKLQENSATGKYKAKKLVKSSVTSTLLKKELKTYFSIPVYIINSGFGIVLIAILTIASFFYSKEYILQAMQNNDLGGLSGNLYIMLLVIFVFTISMTNTTSSSVSLEGKNIDILKSLPVSAKQILNSKLYVNLIVIIPISIISIIVLGMKMGISSLQILTIAGVIVLMSITTSQFGLICNLLFPKLNFKAPVQVVKQGMSMTVAMLSMFAFDVLLIMGYFFLSKMISIDVYSYIIIGIFVVAIIAQNMILNKWGQKKFKKLSY